MIEVVLYTQHPPRSAAPSINSFITKIEDGKETILAEFPVLGNSLKNLDAVLKTAGLRKADVSVREERARACTHFADLEGAKPSSTKAPAFTVDRRFELMGKAVRMTATGALASCFIVGQGGLGKTFTVKQHLKALDREFTNAIVGEIGGYEGLDNGEAEDKIVYVKGSVSTAFALYQILHNHRNQTIVFDDCDNVIDNETQINILKGVLDTDEDRTVSWMNQSAERMGYSTSFEFTGSIIFISNKMLEEVPQAVRSRSTLINLTLSEKEIFDRIRTIGAVMAKDFSAEEVNEVVNMMYDNRASLKELSLRTFIKAAQFYREHPEDAVDMCIFLL